MKLGVNEIGELDLVHTSFVDLEKAFHRVPREVISWAMCKHGVEEWLVSAVMSMYTHDRLTHDRLTAFDPGQPG